MAAVPPVFAASGAIGLAAAGIADAARPSGGGWWSLAVGVVTTLAVAGIGAYGLIRQARIGRAPEDVNAITIAATADANVTTLRHDLEAEKTARQQADEDEKTERQRADDHIWDAIEKIEEHVRPWPDQQRRRSRPTRDDDG